MQLDERLNLIIPVERGAAGLFFVHVAPLPREVFEAHYLLVSKTFTAIMSEGLSVIAGPRVAGLMLRDVAMRSNQWEGPRGGSTLLAEMVRLSNVAVPGPNGYEQMPLQTAIDRKVFSDEERSEVIGSVVFFMVNSAMHKRAILDVLMENMAGLWGTRTSLLDITGFIASLRTSTAAGNTGGTAAGASAPS